MLYGLFIRIATSLAFFKMQSWKVVALTTSGNHVIHIVSSQDDAVAERVAMERGSSAVECRTRNQVSPGSNPRFEDWAFSFSSLMPYLTQLNK